MDTRAVLRPVGPHEPRVYWTRRAILLLAVVLVVVLFAAYACSGGGPRPAAHRAGPTPSATPTPTPSASTPPKPCASGRVSVAASTDATTYPAGVLPHLRATIRTTSTSPCTLTRSAIGWEIVSGADTVFTTAGCAKTGGGVFTVRPNHPVVVALTWDRHRSTAGCASPGATADPGTYQLHITVAGTRSGVAVFHLTG